MQVSIGSLQLVKKAHMHMNTHNSLMMMDQFLKFSIFHFKSASIFFIYIYIFPRKMIIDKDVSPLGF